MVFRFLAPMIIALSWIYSAFFSCISVIVGGKAKPQVVWVAARRVIASMADQHSFWNTSYINFICNSMRPKMHSFTTFFFNIKLAVPIFVLTAGPNQTVALFNNSIPETFFESFTPSHNSIMQEAA